MASALLTCPPQRSSHYIPISLINQSPLSPSISPSISPRRPLSCVAFGNSTMGFFKPNNTSRPSLERANSKSLKQRKSVSSLFSFASESTVTPQSPSKPSPSLQSAAEPVVEEEEEQEESTVHHWLTRCGMRLHPFGRDAPYVQAYDSLQLDNDRHTEALLQLLNPNGGPSFHDYGKYHPQTVLDLGCGEGHWALHAASAWKHSRIVAFDLVNITLYDFDTKPNLEFVQGNFLKRKLPFDDNTFDLVRMANLTLAIPYEKWKFVISEVHRVLTVGGRLELIDDQFVFPYAKEPTPKAAVSRRLSDDFDDFSSDEDDDTLEGESDSLSDPAPTLVESDASSWSSHKKGKESDVIVQLTPPTSPSVTDVSPCPDPQARPQPRPWSEQAQACKDLEETFQRMLVQKYAIHPRPSEFLTDVMKQIFGKANAGKRTSMHLKLPQTGPTSPTSPIDGKTAKKSWLTIEWDKKDRPPVPSTVVPEGISAKAAGRLGINYSTLAAVVAAQSSSSSSLASQSPGIVLWPSTFITLPQAELEMHACKHLHTLLGCKPALREWVTSFYDKESKRMIDTNSFEDFIWDYETFIRRRFNWPSEFPDNFDIDDTPKPKRASSETSDCGKSFKDEDLLHIRSLRVFEAIKA